MEESHHGSARVSKSAMHPNQLLSEENTNELIPHAFHWNLPALHRNSENIPDITEFAHAKARAIVQLCHSIQLSTSLFEEEEKSKESQTFPTIPFRTKSDAMDLLVDEEGDDEDEEGEGEDEDGAAEDGMTTPHSQQDSLVNVLKKCFRLSSQVVAWEGFKYGGISALEMAQMVLHILKLITASLIRKNGSDGPLELVYENSVGYIQYYDANNKTICTPPQNGNNPLDTFSDFQPTQTAQELQQQLQHPFALPAPARDSLLAVLCQFLSNKAPLRGASNAALVADYDEHNNTPHFRLVLHWQVLLRLLVRTAPYLDPHQYEPVPSDSSARISAIQKRTVQFIRDARRFFDSPNAATQIWNMVRNDLLFHSHTHACYRGTILLYLFLPSKCPSEFYQTVLPDWLNAWTNIDRCPEYDFLWLALFCRARKYLRNNSHEHPLPDWVHTWKSVRRRLLTLCQYWCLLPIGGTTQDKAWTQAPHPRSRVCPAKLKALTSTATSYEEGIDFVAKIAKLLVASLGYHYDSNKQQPSKDSHANRQFSEGTEDILQFLNYVMPYFHPSNLGSWTFTLGAFLHYFCYELAYRVGTVAGLKILKQHHTSVYNALEQAQPAVVSQVIPPHEVVALVHALLPLCQQSLYSKNSHVSRAAEAAMLYLVQMDPPATTPAFWDFGMRALDIQAVNSAHQAPAALSALTRLVQPTLRRAPGVLLRRLPTLLQLTLAGIDSNDQNKTIRTLIFYRSLASWMPIGTNAKTEARKWTSQDSSKLRQDGIIRPGTNLMEALDEERQSLEYQTALSRLPPNTLLKHDPGNSDALDDFLLDEVSAATADWVPEFLERVFELLRSMGEREKAGKRNSGVASRHSSADVHAARNFSRVLKESLFQVFCAMEDSTFLIAANAVKRFVQEETLPAAAKDASLLCQAVAAARGERKNPGMKILVPILTDDLVHHSTKTAVYRVRCLAGSVRLAGKAILEHRKAISETMDFCFASEDRTLFKTGCKLLRHSLATLTEPNPLPIDSKPRVYRTQSGALYLGKSAELADDAIQWHVPDGECVEFAWELLSKHVMQRMDELASPVPSSGGAPRSRMLNAGDIVEIRRCLRLIRYSIRGGAGLLVDEALPEPSSDPKDSIPHELACHRILEQASFETREKIVLVRRSLCKFLVVLSSIIGSDTLHPGGLEQIPSSDSYAKSIPLISRDAKVCKETCDIALLLLTRRGASFRSQEAMTVWKAQKQISNDYTLTAEVDVILEGLQAAGLFEPHVLFKDGEDGGKSIPRRVLVSRVHLFHNSLIRNASFEVPRRMRRMTRDEKEDKKEILFKAKSNLPEMLEYLENVLVESKPRPLDAYEGILDGLHTLCCHSNTQVRASAIGVVDYALTRFGWLLRSRISRLLSAISLQDLDQNGKFGIPSCALLTDKLNNQGKRKRLSEAMKGACSILALQRTTKFILGSHKLRCQFMTTLCETDRLISLMPAEEMQKMIHYMHNVFSPYRSKIFNLPRPTKHDKESHVELLRLSIEFLSERKRVNGDAETEEKTGAAVHWRKMLQACWFLLVSVDEEDVLEGGEVIQASWKTCVRFIENEKGQPLQRAALGLVGKLVFLSEKESVESELAPKLEAESFCKALADALVYDHKEDTSYGGGHDAQWSAGVEDIIRDAARFIAPKNLFPFQRTNIGSGSFKASHCQLLAHILSCLSIEQAQAAIAIFLRISKDMLTSPPNEDQKNQQVTSAEIFAGVLNYYITSGLISDDLWNTTILPHFDDAIAKLPFSLASAYSDALRFALQFCDPSLFYPLVEFTVEKIRKSLWQTTKEGSYEGLLPQNGLSHGTDGFNAQSKWLYLASSILVELDVNDSDGAESRNYWYLSSLTMEDTAWQERAVTSYQKSWALVIEKLLPCLLSALGHPFHNCRDHVARLLFRICSCYRKRNKAIASRTPDRTDSSNVEDLVMSFEDPGSVIVSTLSSLNNSKDLTFLDKYNALSTARRFLSYCLHLGESKFELTDYVIPVLPIVFESLKSTVEEAILSTADSISQEEQATLRALEAEVLKGFRYAVSEISQTMTAPNCSNDIDRILDFVQTAAHHETWQVRQAVAQFLRCFQGSHKFLFTTEHKDRTMAMVAELLADDRREVCSAAMAALTGVLTGLSTEEITQMVEKYVHLADRSKMKRKKAVTLGDALSTSELEHDARETKRARNQQISVFFLCAAVMAQPYDTPPYVPVALTAISKHSFERTAPLSIRDTVKRCCAEYKRTHMSDNWDEHRSAFTQEQMEALEDVVSSPHYYA